MKTIKQIGGYGSSGASMAPTYYDVTGKFQGLGPITSRSLYAGNYAFKAQSCEDAMAKFKTTFPEGYKNPNNEYGPRIFPEKCEQQGKDIYLTFQGNEKPSAVSAPAAAVSYPPKSIDYPIYFKYPDESLKGFYYAKGNIYKTDNCKSALNIYKDNYEGGIPFKQVNKSMMGKTTVTNIRVFPVNCQIDKQNNRIVLTLQPRSKGGKKSKKRKSNSKSKSKSMKGGRRKKTLKRKRH